MYGYGIEYVPAPYVRLSYAIYLYIYIGTPLPTYQYVFCDCVRVLLFIIIKGQFYYLHIKTYRNKTLLYHILNNSALRCFFFLVYSLGTGWCYTILGAYHLHI